MIYHTHKPIEPVLVPSSLKQTVGHLKSRGVLLSFLQIIHVLTAQNLHEISRSRSLSEDLSSELDFLAPITNTVHACRPFPLPFSSVRSALSSSCWWRANRAEPKENFKFCRGGNGTRFPAVASESDDPSASLRQ
jgi:hypothetical protein